MSVLCPTIHPGSLVAAVLAPLTAVADEIIVAADSRVDPADLGAYASVADRVLRFEHAGANKHWPWLAAQARGRWLLILDGDELVSTALLDALPVLLEDQRVAQYSLPIHWPWRGADAAAPVERLAGPPWASDRRLRLLRNDPRLLFAARKHRLAEAMPPISYRRDLPVYHLDLLTTDETTRATKVAAHDREGFGMLTAEGTPFNAAVYLPERAPEPPPTSPIPADDAERIDQVVLGMSAPPAGAPVDPAGIPLTSRREILRFAPDTVLREEQRGHLAIVELPEFVAERALHEVWVEVTNRGTARWPGPVRLGSTVHVGVRWEYDADEPPLEGERAPVSHALDPGETLLMPIHVKAPERPGPATLVLDLVDDQRWYGTPARCPVSVTPSVRDRLSALTRRVGSPLPLDAVLDLRRQVASVNGLVPGPDRQDAAPPDDPRLAALTEGLTLGDWAIDRATIALLADHVRALRPSAVTEFGSGTSTIVLAALLAEQGREDARLICIEQDPAWLGRTWERLERLGLQRWVVPVHADVGPAPGGGPPCYLLGDSARDLLRAHPPQLVFVDGPILDADGSRLGTIDLVAPALERPAVVLLDDAFRDAELTIGAQWSRRPDVDLRGIHPTPKGMLEALLRPRAT